MNERMASQALDMCIKRIIDMILALSLLTLVSIPLAQAFESKPQFDGKTQAQPTIRTPANPETEKSMDQALKAQLPKTSIDFLMGESLPLPQTSGGTTPQTMPSPMPAPETMPAPLTEVINPLHRKAEEVAVLISERCSQGGNAAEGTNACERVYSNGHHATLLTQSANEGDELKRQTVIDEFDRDGNFLFKKTIRHRVDYLYLNDQKSKEKEFFDILYQPADKKTTRELMVYEYFPDTGKTRSLSWAQYKQIENEPRAELVYNAMLRYSADGNPDRGIAEQWNKGVKTVTFLNWNRHSSNYAPTTPETWRQWEVWIGTVSLEAYLP